MRTGGEFDRLVTSYVLQVMSPKSSKEASGKVATEGMPSPRQAGGDSFATAESLHGYQTPPVRRAGGDSMPVGSPSSSVYPVFEERSAPAFEVGAGGDSLQGLRPPGASMDLQLLMQAQQLLARLQEAPDGGTPAQGSEDSNEPSPEKNPESNDARIVRELVGRISSFSKEIQLLERKSTSSSKELRNKDSVIKSVRSNFERVSQELQNEKLLHEQLASQWHLTNLESVDLRVKVDDQT